MSENSIISQILHVLMDREICLESDKTHLSLGNHLEKTEEVLIILSLLLESGNSMFDPIIDVLPIIMKKTKEFLIKLDNFKIFTLDAMSNSFMKVFNDLMNVQDVMQLLCSILQNISTTPDRKTICDKLCTSIMIVNTIINEHIANMKNLIIESFKLSLWTISDDLIRQVLVDLFNNSKFKRASVFKYYYTSNLIP